MRLEDKDLSGRHYSSAGASLGAERPLSTDTILGTLGGGPRVNGLVTDWTRLNTMRTSLVRAKHAKPAFAKRAAVSAVATSASSPAFLDATPAQFDKSTALHAVAG